jgi:transposase
LEGLLPEGHLARFIWQALTSIDFSELEASFHSVDGRPGRPPYHPRVMAALWTYGMTQGMETAAEIAEACRIRDDFRWLAGGLCPSDQTLLNFLTRAEGRLSLIWTQLLRAMHQAGHVDLSAVAEDGTKLRANASHASFHSADEIEVVIGQLRRELEGRLAQAGACPQGRPNPNPKDGAAIGRLQRRLARAEQAAEELRERERRRACKGATKPQAPDRQATASGGPHATVPESTSRTQRFGRADFRFDADRDVMLCPTEQELHLIGEYPTENGRGRYRLYGRSDCSGCALKPECTNAKGRRLKVPQAQANEPTAASPPDSMDLSTPRHSTAPRDGSSPAATPTHAAAATTPEDQGHEEEERPVGPQASLTDPEAVMMLATSEKRWEPSYNADITVTRHGVIISQFLTKRPTDYHGFEPALKAVCSTLGTPESWVGDGHYGTHANLLLAAQAGVVLYASSARAAARAGEAKTAPADSAAPASPTEPVIKPPIDAKPARLNRADFHHDPERDTLICPAGQELRHLGTYPTESGRHYRLYGRSDCVDCPLKSSCTEAKGRRVKLINDTPLPSARPNVQEPASVALAAPPSTPDLGALIQAHEARMREVGPNVMRFRAQTVEPVNSQLKQHGLQRFHVRGLARCSVVLTFGCIAHNLMKWNAREAARAMSLAA